MKQNALIAIVPILSEKLPDLEIYLAKLWDDVENNKDLRFRDSRSTHFARWVILDATTEPRLFFSTCYDGEFAHYIAELTTKLGTGMEPIWNCCKGYHPYAASDPKKFSDFLLPHCYEPDISLVAFPGLAASQINHNKEFREQFDDALDVMQSKLPHVTQPLSQSVSIAPKITQSSAYFAALAAKIIDWLVGVRRGAKAPNTMLNTKKLLIENEDLVIQNQMTIISKVKQGFWPRFLLKVFLFLGRFNKPSSRGEFSGLSTIHFARWVLIDGGDNLLFESNYDGSWESYIDDFGDHAASGMNAVWGNCIGFPLGGCLDIESFKQVIRDHQHTAQFFYSAYPDQTVTNIANDLALSRALSAVNPYLSGAPAAMI